MTDEIKPGDEVWVRAMVVDGGGRSDFHVRVECADEDDPPTFLWVEPTQLAPRKDAPAPPKPEELQARIEKLETLNARARNFAARVMSAPHSLAPSTLESWRKLKWDARRVYDPAQPFLRKYPDGDPPPLKEEPKPDGEPMVSRAELAAVVGSLVRAVDCLRHDEHAGCEEYLSGAFARMRRLQRGEDARGGEGRE